MTDRNAAVRERSSGCVFRLSHASSLAAGLCVIIIMAVGAIDVIGTTFFDRPVPGAYELTETMMVAAVFLALALSQAEGRHIRVDVLIVRLGPRARAVFDLVAHLMTAAVFGLIAWYGWLSALEAVRVGDYTSGMIKFPVWPAKFCLGVGAVLMVVQALADATGALRRASR